MKHMLVAVLLLSIASIGKVDLKAAFDKTTLARSIAVLQELKVANKKIYPRQKLKQALSSCGQTHAYLRVDWLKEAVQRDFGADRARLRPLINKILTKEAALADNYYIFYHGQEITHKLIQDITKQLFEGLTLKKLPKDFIYLRMPLGIFDKALTPEQFIQQCNRQFPSGWNDLNSTIGSKLLSLNLSLFGNTTRRLFGECSFQFFLESASIHSFDKTQLLDQFFNAYNFDRALLPQAQELLGLLKKASEGQLLQIAIAKEQIDNYVYLSYVHGVPYGQSLVKDCFDPVVKRHTKLGPILDVYKTQPLAISMLDTLQARLLITEDRVLRPTADMKIYRYITLDKKYKREYTSKLKLFVEKLLANWTQRNNNNGFFVHYYPLGRLAYYKTILPR